MNNAQLISGGVSIGAGVLAFYLLKYFKKDVLWTFPIAAATMIAMVIISNEKDKQKSKGENLAINQTQTTDGDLTAQTQEKK